VLASSAPAEVRVVKAQAGQARGVTDDLRTMSLDAAHNGRYWLARATVRYVGTAFAFHPDCRPT
ncbi:MAG TPA: hypothetical protein VN961_13010, partial [Streptosporangiaceae bacterium]|nr:hypothetical protein [Streptosporangiaceae bacterium]